MRIRNVLAIGLVTAATGVGALAAAPAANASGFPYTCGDSSSSNVWMVGGTEIDGLPDGFCVPRYELEMQTDGNLVEYNTKGTAVWSTHTSGHRGAYALFQTDGNLVIYSSGIALWSSHTSGHVGARLVFQTDGNLVIYSSGGSVLWASGSNGK